MCGGKRMLFLKEHPHYIFRIDERPQFIDDLVDVDVSSTELLIQGKTKNIERLKSFSNLMTSHSDLSFIHSKYRQNVCRICAFNLYPPYISL
jgi:hypothetical protein